MSTRPELVVKLVCDARCPIVISCQSTMITLTGVRTAHAGLLEQAELAHIDPSGEQVVLAKARRSRSFLTLNRCHSERARSDLR
jgi:hypothetical protein